MKKNRSKRFRSSRILQGKVEEMWIKIKEIWFRDWAIVVATHRESHHFTNNSTFHPLETEKNQQHETKDCFQAAFWLNVKLYDKMLIIINFVMSIEFFHIFYACICICKLPKNIQAFEGLRSFIILVSIDEFIIDKIKKNIFYLH